MSGLNAYNFLRGLINMLSKSGSYLNLLEFVAQLSYNSVYQTLMLLHAEMVSNLHY